MTQMLPGRSSKKAVQDPATARELLLMYASALIGRQIREQYWIMTGGIGIAIFSIVGVGHLAFELGYLKPSALPSFDLVGVSQALALLIFLLTAAAFLVGRLRMIRSEMDLLRLKLEMFSGDMTEQIAVAEQAAPVRKSAPVRVKAPRRRIKLRSSD